MLRRILDKVDEKVFWCSLVCAVVRYGLGIIQNVTLMAALQTAVGVFTIALIFNEYRRDKRFYTKHYITYFLGAFFLLIILTGVKLAGINFLNTTFLFKPLIWTWTAIMIALWAFVNAFLFEFFKNSSHKAFDKTHF